jgi:hypothetical protein
LIPLLNYLEKIIFGVILALLQTYKPNELEKAQKIKKKFFKCVIEFSFASIHGSGLLICSKKFKIFVAHRVPTPILSSSTQGKACRNHLKDKISPLLPTGIGE